MRGPSLLTPAVTIRISPLIQNNIDLDQDIFGARKLSHATNRRNKGIEQKTGVFQVI
jgi:hypothetical protein